MKETKKSLSELWSLLRKKEKDLGLYSLTLTERDIFEVIIYLQGKQNKISLDNLLKNCRHPRATFFRCLKKLRASKMIHILKDSQDNRKSFIKVADKFIEN